MAKNPFPIQADPAGPGVYLLTAEQAALLFTEEQIQKRDSVRGEIETYGPWHIIKSYTALATTHDWKDGPTCRLADGPLTIFGKRKLSKTSPIGHQLEGTVHVKGGRYRAFTSSQLFQLPSGDLIDVAILHVCMDQPK